MENNILTKEFLKAVADDLWHRYVPSYEELEEGRRQYEEYMRLHRLRRELATLPEIQWSFRKPDLSNAPAVSKRYSRRNRWRCYHKN